MAAVAEYWVWLRSALAPKRYNDVLHGGAWVRIAVLRCIEQLVYVSIPFFSVLTYIADYIVFDSVHLYRCGLACNSRPRRLRKSRKQAGLSIISKLYLKALVYFP